MPILDTFKIFQSSHYIDMSKIILSLMNSKYFVDKFLPICKVGDLQWLHIMISIFQIKRYSVSDAANNYIELIKFSMEWNNIHLVERVPIDVKKNSQKYDQKAKN